MFFRCELCTRGHASTARRSTCYVVYGTQADFRSSLDAIREPRYFTTPWTRPRLRARSIGLIRIRRIPQFSDYAFDSAHLNLDGSSRLIHLIRKKLRMSSDELDTRPRLREDVTVLRLPHSDLNRTVTQCSKRISSIVILYFSGIHQRQYALITGSPRVRW